MDSINHLLTRLFDFLGKKNPQLAEKLKTSMNSRLGQGFILEYVKPGHSGGQRFYHERTDRLYTG